MVFVEENKIWKCGFYGTSGRTRTCNLLIRSQELYPIELPTHPLLSCTDSLIRNEFIISRFPENGKSVFYLACRGWSGRCDSNARPSEPHSDALTRLRYAPTFPWPRERLNSLYAGTVGMFNTFPAKLCYPFNFVYRSSPLSAWMQRLTA